MIQCSKSDKCDVRRCVYIYINQTKKTYNGGHRTIKKEASRDLKKHFEVINFIPGHFVDFLEDIYQENILDVSSPLTHSIYIEDLLPDLTKIADDRVKGDTPSRPITSLKLHPVTKSSQSAFSIWVRSKFSGLPKMSSRPWPIVYRVCVDWLLVGALVLGRYCVR